MIKCDFCGAKAKTRLFTINLDTKEKHNLGEICDKCAEDLAIAIIQITNTRMREKYGNRAMIIPIHKEEDNNA